MTDVTTPPTVVPDPTTSKKIVVKKKPLRTVKRPIRGPSQR